MTTMTSTTIDKANGFGSGRVGRPRANPRPLERPPEEEILAVAGKLFARKGFTATSTREIAEAAGLRQPSLFHYYPKKEKILEALLGRIGQWTIEFAQQLQRLQAPAAAKLYRMIFFEVYNVCSAPYPVSSIIYLPEVRYPAFPSFWQDMHQLTGIYEALIERAVAEGDLAATDAKLTALSLMGAGTGTHTWYWRQDERSPEDVAHHVASQQLRALLESPARLDTVRAAAASLQL